MGFEPTRGDPIGLAGRRLNRSAKVPLMLKVAKTNDEKSVFLQVIYISQLKLFALDYAQGSQKLVKLELPLPATLHH